MSETVIQTNYRDYSYQCGHVEIPISGFHRENKVIEIRRSMLTDAAFIIVEDDNPLVVPQGDIWMVIHNVSLFMFKEFGIYMPDITWRDRTKRRVDSSG